MTDFKVPSPQVQQSLDPKDYDVRIIVAGTRYYNDRKRFHEVMCRYLERFEGQDVLFISGVAPTGADRLIIDWCNKFGFPCLEMPAKWQLEDGSTDRAAGFKRNIAMAEVGSHLVTFWDNHSPGTAHMIEEATTRQLPTKIVEIDIPIRV